jgi:hypothetical protein
VVVPGFEGLGELGDGLCLVALGGVVGGEAEGGGAHCVRGDWGSGIGDRVLRTGGWCDRQWF